MCFLRKCTYADDSAFCVYRKYKNVILYSLFKFFLIQQEYTQYTARTSSEEQI